MTFNVENRRGQNFVLRYGEQREGKDLKGMIMFLK
uniref:Uncharacterized protein n=1 Tax=Bacillus cereus HuA4-10 TaxID=1053206 RepID=J8DM95_BACCE|nr:hypothetical protein IGC_00721 [Bacillus cereus HuA4-10]